MVRINKVYTRKGDGGNTSLVGGEERPKHDLRVECYGTVDELNAVLGVARASNAAAGEGELSARVENLLRFLQHRLFDLGGELATPPGVGAASQFDAGQVTWLEGVIDSLNAGLEPLRSFVLPGGGLVAAHLHQARTVCRRAERLAVALAAQEALPGQTLAYLNRLSDLLFVLSRWVAVKLEEREHLWEPGLSAEDAWPE